MKIPNLSNREFISTVSPRFADHKDVETQTRGKTQQIVVTKDEKSLDTLLSSAGAKDFKKRYYHNVSDSFETFGNNGPDPILHIAEDWNEESRSYEKQSSKECNTPDGVVKTESPIAENSLGEYLPKEAIVRDKKIRCRSTDTYWPKEKLDELEDESRRGFDDSVSIIIHETSFAETSDIQKQNQALQQQLNMEREQWMQHTRELNSTHQQEIDELTQFYELKLREIRKKSDSLSKSESDRVKLQKLLEPESIQNLKEIHEQEKQAIERRQRAECELKLEQQRDKFYRENQENLARLRANLKEEHNKEYTYLREQLSLRLTANESRVKQSHSLDYSSKFKLDLSLNDKEIDTKLREKLDNLKSDYERRIHFLEREKDDLKKQLDTSDLRPYRRQSHSTESSSACQTAELENTPPGSSSQQRSTSSQLLCTKCKTFVQAEGELTHQLNKFRRLMESQ